MSKTELKTRNTGRGMMAKTVETEININKMIPDNLPTLFSQFVFNTTNK